MDERERFEALLDTLDDLAEANRETPILVEGKRDVAALRSLGCRGEIVPVHNGRPLFALAEDVSRSTTQVILLTDWDRKGATLLATLTTSLAANGVRADPTYRDRISSWSNAQLKDIESLLPYVTRGLAHFRLSLDRRERATG